MTFTIPFTIPFTLSFTIYGLPGYIREFPSEIEAIRGGSDPPLSRYEKYKDHTTIPMIENDADVQVG